MTHVPDVHPCVLLVDDDAEVLALMERLLHKADSTVEVVVAHDGLEAMAYLSEASRGSPDTPHLPGLILLDVGMPGVDGFEVLRWVRHHHALDHIKVVMLSSSDSAADIARATELGAHGYFIKFPQPMLLACVLHEACGRILRS